MRSHKYPKAPISFVPSVRLSAYVSAAPTGRIVVKFYVGACTKICRGTPDVTKIGQQYLALDMNTKIRLYCWRQYEMFGSSTAAEGTRSCVSIGTLDGFILLTATCKPASIATMVTRTDHSVRTNISYLVYLNSVPRRRWCYLLRHVFRIRLFCQLPDKKKDDLLNCYLTVWSREMYIVHL